MSFDSVDTELIEEVEWSVKQSFMKEPPEGESEAPPQDVITALSFNHTGAYLAVGDRGGRITIYEQTDARKSNMILRPGAKGLLSKSSSDKSLLSSAASSGGLVRPPSFQNLRDGMSRKVSLEGSVMKGSAFNYSMIGEFLSHDPEFDYLKSLEIEGKINKIQWLKKSNHATQLLSCNDKTIKLWKLQFARERFFNSEGCNDAGGITVPAVTYSTPYFSNKSRRTYKNAHTFHINSVSCNSDGSTFISSDDLRINLWDYEISNTCFNIVDIKPDDMEDLSEVITASQFHPQHCNILMYCSSGGIIRLVDTRASALCDFETKKFSCPDNEEKTFFSEIIGSISDAKFSADGRYIVTRDFLTIKVWDVNMESSPISSFNIHEHLRPKLSEAYDNDAIFDKFEVGVSGNCKNFVTGSYNDIFSVNHFSGSKEKHIECIVNKPKIVKKISFTKKKEVKSGILNTDSTDYSKKILHLDYHPEGHCIATAARNKLYFTVGDKLMH
jgi:serine/threonine-protein phosphatase 2A regulatory subunit B